MIHINGSVNYENRQLILKGKINLCFPVTNDKICEALSEIGLIFVVTGCTVHPYSNSQGWIDYVHFRLCTSFFVVLIRRSKIARVSTENTTAGLISEVAIAKISP